MLLCRGRRFLPLQQTAEVHLRVGVMRIGFEDFPSALDVRQLQLDVS
jgi:hypothetical protein